MSRFTEIPHCSTCSCGPPVPSTFVSEVRLLPFDLNRETVVRFKSGRTSTNKAVRVVRFDPSRHHHLDARLRTYQHMLTSGHAGNVREAVKILAHLRREAFAAETARLAPSIAKRALFRRKKSGFERSLQFKRKLVLAGDPPCTYCGIPSARGVDHIMPTARGGKHGLTNLTPACGPCNNEKNNRTPAEWKAWRLTRGLAWPPVRTGCPLCGNTGRTSVDGPDRHCSCIRGRRMAHAHWEVKAAEEVQA